MCTTLGLLDTAVTAGTGTGRFPERLLGFLLGSPCRLGLFSVIEALTFLVVVETIVLQAVDLLALMAFEAVLVGV